MRARSLKLLTEWSQIITAGAAVLACAYAIYHGNRTLVEAQEARIAMAKPHLGLILGPAGLGSHAVRFARYDMLGTSASNIGTVRNYGAGPALNIRLEWQVDKVEGIDLVTIKKSRRSQSTRPRNLMPSETATVVHLPGFLWDAHDQKFVVGGKLILDYDDTMGGHHRVVEPFQMSNEPSDEEGSDSTVVINLTETPLL